MQSAHLSRKWIIALLIISSIGIWISSLPVMGQGGNRFATNTPEGLPPFPTNTPDRSSEIATRVPDAMMMTNTPDLFSDIVEPTRDPAAPLATNTRAFSSEIVTLTPTLPITEEPTEEADFSSEVVTSIPATLPPNLSGVLATNTPAGAPAFATNTPPQAQVLLPVASFDNYALRLWLEGDFLEVLYNQILQVDTARPETSRVVVLLQYEMERRFPGAPRDIAQRQRLIDAMLDAPRGSVDMRPLVRPYIEVALNANRGEAAFIFNNFEVQLINANLDGANPVDAVVHIRYPAGETDPEQILYEDFVFAIRDVDGSMTIAPADPDIPAAPYASIETISLNRLGDVNRDGLDEMVLVQNDRRLNQRLLIKAYRGEQAVELSLPDTPIRFGAIIQWPTDSVDPNPVLTTALYQEESGSNWGCISEQLTSWTYSSNFYRRVDTTGPFTPQDTLACRLHQAEPLFMLPPANAIALVDSALAQYGEDAPAASRAIMTLAMLNVLNGDLEQATQLAQNVPISGPEAEWAASQSQVFQIALSDPDNTAITVCELLILANRDAACDMNSILERLFMDLQLTTSIDLLQQFETLNLPVRESTIISEVGRADRIAVRFALEGSGWWAFAPIGEDNTYVAERFTSPTVADPAPVTNQSLGAPPAAYDEILGDDDLAAAVNVIETLARENPQRTLSPEAQFIQAWGNDLLGNRQAARRFYFELWVSAPESVWGQAAARHLELR